MRAIGIVVRGVVCVVAVGLAAAGCGHHESDHRAQVAPTGGVTSTPVATPAGRCCARAIDLAIDGPNVDLDLGATGINYDTHFPRGIRVNVAASCRPDGDVCGTCTLDALPTAPRRCFDDVSHPCSADVDCPASRCLQLFSPPLPLNAGSVPSCAIDEVLAVGPGTFDSVTGEIVLPLTLHWTFFQGLDVGVPCPRCTGAGLGDVGVCAGGLHDGAPCRVEASDDVFGNTSLDCPPSNGADVGGFDLPMVLTTGTSRLDADQPCRGAPFAGEPCYCAGQPIANSCRAGHCVDMADGDAVCVDGPSDGACALESFRGCQHDDECPAPGDHCEFRPRECLGAADDARGIVEPLVRTGRVGTSDELLVATFCVPPGSSVVGNVGLALPSAASLRLPVTATVVDACAGK